MKKINDCFIMNSGLYYVSDNNGFALLYLNTVEIKVYCYDFEKTFSINIKVQIPGYSNRKTKLCCRSIWIVTKTFRETQKSCLIDVINIKNKREWHHMTQEMTQEISKMFVRASATIAFVINMRTFQVSQILEYRSSFSAGMCFKWSEQNRMLNIKVNLEYQISRPNQYFYLKHVLYNGLTLKSLTLNALTETFSLENIQSSNLPLSLVQEILDMVF